MQAEIPMISINKLDLTLGTGASQVHVLKSLSLDIEAGQSAGIVGPSGSGKSTLLMVIGGLERADSGEISINGETLGNMNEDQLAGFRGKNIGIVFQSFHLIPNMTALENVAVPLELSGQKDALQRARQELQAVGLGERLDHFPAQLSGGEQQRVAIARALVARPKILIADEPTGNLDDDTGDQVVQLLFDKQRDYGMTLVLVTHDNNLAAKCDRITKMRSGEIVGPKTKAKTTSRKQRA